MLGLRKRFANDIPCNPGQWFRVVNVTVPSYHLELYGIIMDVMQVEAEFCIPLPEGSGPPHWEGWQNADVRLIDFCRDYAQTRACQDVTVLLSTISSTEE